MTSYHRGLPVCLSHREYIFESCAQVLQSNTRHKSKGISKGHPSQYESGVGGGGGGNYPSEISHSRNMDVMQPLKTHVYCLFTFYEVIYMYVTLKKENILKILAVLIQ